MIRLRDLTPAEEAIVEKEFQKQWIKINEVAFEKSLQPLPAFVDAVDPRKKNHARYKQMTSYTQAHASAAPSFSS